MVDLSLSRTGPLGPAGLLFEAEGVRVLVSPPVARVLLRCPADVIARAGAALGLNLPLAPMRTQTKCAQTLRTQAAGQGVTALWLGPDETLLVGAAQDLPEALHGLAHALVDVSHRDVALDVEGPGAAQLLASAIMLDLAPGAFPEGACARTLFGKAPVLVWRRGVEAFQLQTPRSCGVYVRDLLREAFLVPPAAGA